MTFAIGGFVSTWAPSYSSTMYRVDLRNVRQGGNNFLAFGPLNGQAMWGGALLSTVCSAAQGPLKWVGLFFRYLFHPLIHFPLSLLAYTVKERLYESSIAANVGEQTKYFRLGVEIDQPVHGGTIPIVVNGQLRHFTLGNDVTQTVLSDQNDRRRFGLEENYDKNFIEFEVLGKKRYIEIESEAARPTPGTITIENGWHYRHFFIGEELPAAEPNNCFRVKINNTQFHYETGHEIPRPTDQSYSFMIEGKERHFASATYVPSPKPQLSGYFNRIPKIPVKLPTRLRYITTRALELANDHMSDVIRTSILVAGAALLYLGQTAMALGALSAIAYEHLDHDLGIIPRKVSLFMEKYMPTISLCGLLIVGSLTSQILAGASLLMMIPQVKLAFHHKVGKQIRRVVLSGLNLLARRNGQNLSTNPQLAAMFASQPYLEELDAPLEENRSLTKPEIDRILNAAEDRFELNPAHLTKSFEPVLNLPENRNFSELTRLWDAEGNYWTRPDTYARLLTRLLDDERFFLFLKERFPEAKPFDYEPSARLSNSENRNRREELKGVHRNQIENWLQILAQEKRLTKETFVAAWVKQQLEIFVGKLSGRLPIEGEQRFLAESVDNCAKIIPFLTNQNTPRVERQDALVKLAIEGGNYCALGMKRASKEVLDGFTEPLLLQQEPDPHKAFEIEVRLSFQKARLRRLQMAYSKVIDLMSKAKVLKKTGEDIHLYAAVLRSLKRGIYPLETHELDEFSFTELAMREGFLWMGHSGLLDEYRAKIPELMNELGVDRRNERGNRILNYLRNWVQESHTLTEVEKTDLLHGALANTEDNIIDDSNYPKWNRLMLTILGVMRAKN